MLMGGAVDVWMLHLGRFLTGVAGGMTAASIPVRYTGCSTFRKKIFLVPEGRGVLGRGMLLISVLTWFVRMTYVFTCLSLQLFFGLSYSK